MRFRKLRCVFYSLFALALALSVHAQSNAVPPPPAPPTSQSPQEPAPAIKSETVAIPVRAVVRDRKGRPVANLKKENFEVYQDGQLEPISNFTAISGTANSAPVESSESAASTTAAASSGSPAAPTQAQSALGPQRYLALFFDDMHLQSKDLDYTTADAAKYLASLPATDHVAIITASRQDQLDFTTDRIKLQNAITSLKIHPAPAGKVSTATVPISIGCPAMDYWEADAIVNGSGLAASGVLQDAKADLWTCSHTDSKSLPDRVATAIVLNVARAALAQADVQTETVLQRIQELVSSMSSLPGQRVIVLISPGFLYKTHRRQLSDLINRAIQSDVVVNSIETRRGFNLAAMAQSWNRPQIQLGAVESQAGSDSQTVLGDIAHSTGGQIFVGATDYGSAFSHFAVAPDSYYLLVYSPPNPPADGKYHTIKVKLVSQSNLTVETRRGFYAPSHAETAEEVATREIDDALFSNEEEHGLPVKFEIQVLPGAAGWQNVVVQADVDLLHLHLRNANGLNQENLRFAGIVFDTDGYYLAGSSKNVQINLDSATIAQLAKTNTGYHVDMDFYARPGQYTIRLVVHDSNDERISAENASVTIPSEPAEKK